MKSLSLAQQLEIEKYKRASIKMTKQQIVELLIQATRLRMIKDNVINHLKRQ